jgi:DNA polymerase-3 subunit beta
MKFSIDKQSLSESLKKFQGILEKNAVVPIASSLLFEAKENELMISATNFEVGIIVRKNLPVMEKGTIVVDGQKFTEIVNQMPEGEILLERKDDGWITIRHGKNIQFNLAVLSDEKIPPIKIDEKVRYGEIEAGLLSELIKRTMYAVSDDRTRDVLRGILIEGEKSKVRMVATDGHRLALVEKDGVFGKSAELKKGTIVPKKGAREIRRLAQELKNDAVVKVGFSDKIITITEGGETLIVRLIEGEFPDYRIAIPKDNTIQIVVKIRSFIDTLKRVTLLAEEETRVVKFHCRDGVMIISSKKIGVGEATEELEAEYKGDAVEFGLNSRYVLDVLNTLEGEDVVIEVKDGQTPIVFKEKGQETILSIIMPMML